MHVGQGGAGPLTGNAVQKSQKQQGAMTQPITAPTSWAVNMARGLDSVR